MATQRPAYSVPLSDFIAALLSEREITPRARVCARHVAEMLPGASVAVYVVPNQESPRWEARASEGEISVDDPSITAETGTLGALWAKREPILFLGADVAREEYAHLHLRRSVASLGYVPLKVDETMVGAVEVVTFDTPLSQESLDAVSEIVPYAAASFVTALAYESERNTNLESISRLAQLYDLEKVFAATLEMTELMPIICTKVQQLYSAQAVNLWMVEGEYVLLMEQSGVDPTCSVGQQQRENEGIAGHIGYHGETVIIGDQEDERLTKRNSGVEQGGVTSLIAAPLIYKENLVGVLEVVNKQDGSAFDEDDLFTLTQVAEVAASALNNASLLLAERKVEILQTLVAVSQQITSTLHVDRVLDSVVNAPQAVIPYQRAAIAMEDRGSVRIRAVSGMPQINSMDPEIRRLDEILRWAASFDKEQLITQHGDEIDGDRAETREKFKYYFEMSGSRAFYVVPLSDEQGRLGVLGMESNDPDFLTEAHMEMMKVLAGQASVALRNASLYREVPFIGVLEPLLQKKQRFMAQTRRRRMLTIAIAAIVVAFLVFFPFPMRLDGDALVAPAHTAQVQPMADGVVSNVYVREGDTVKKGTVVAEMESWKERTDLASAEAKYQTAVSEMNRALATNDGTLAGQKRVEADYWSGQVERDRELLEHTRLRSPIDGVIATAHLENVVGQKLDAGQTVLEVVDSNKAVVDVGISERDFPLLKPGVPAALKLEGFPTRTFRGQVMIVSPRSQLDKDERLFYARVEVPNPDGTIRPGMQGRGKVSAGWHPVGYVMFRGIGTWAWTKLWNLIGW